MYSLYLIKHQANYLMRIAGCKRGFWALQRLLQKFLQLICVKFTMPGLNLRSIFNIKSTYYIHIEMAGIG